MFDKLKSLFSQKDDVYEDEVLYHKNGNIMYEGAMKGPMFHGTGKLYNEAGKLIYKGEFRSGERHGHGMA